MIKTLTCAMIATAAVALSAPTLHAAGPVVVVTNFDVVTLNLTIRTNVTRVTGSTTAVRTSAMSRFVTKDLLNLLSKPEFSGINLSNDTLAISWDLSTAADHLVVIDSSKRVVYDVTANTNADANVTFNFGFLLGATTGSVNARSSNVTAFNTGFFTIFDRPDGTNVLLNLMGYGPCTENFRTSSNNTNGIVTSWSHSNTFNAQGANQIFNGAEGAATTTGTITSRGSGTTPPYQLLIGSFGE